MAKTDNLTDFLTNIANAIRTVEGSTDAINPQDFEAKITALKLSVQTADANATAEDILSGKTAWVKGTKISGSIGTKAATTIIPGTSDQTITSGVYLTGTQTIKGDANLIADNIKSGTSIFGVTGSYVGSLPNLQSKSVTYTSNGTATIAPDEGYDGLSSVDVTVDVSGGGGETAENVVITSSLQSYLNEFIQICGIDKDGNKILLNGYTTPVSVKKNTPLMIRISDYPYARISGQYTVIGVYSSGGNTILDSTDIGSGSPVAPLIVPTGDLNIYDTD